MRRVPSTDGYPLAATLFHPAIAGPPSQVILIIPAMGVRQTFYFKLAEFVATSGRLAITFDYRGSGESAPSRLRGFGADLEDWGRRDITAMIQLAGELLPGARVGVVAHSVGGQLFGMATNNENVECVLALGSQSGYWRHWSGRSRRRVWVLWHLIIPILSRVMGYFPGSWFGLGRDTPRDVARMWAYWGRHPDYLMGRLDESGRAGYAGFRGRIRAISATDDWIAPEPAVAAWLEFYPNAQRELRMVAPAELAVDSIGHFGYFREAIGRQLWPSEMGWLFSNGDG